MVVPKKQSEWGKMGQRTTNVVGKRVQEIHIHHQDQALQSRCAKQDPYPLSLGLSSFPAATCFSGPGILD